MIYVWNSINNMQWRNNNDNIEGIQNEHDEFHKIILCWKRSHVKQLRKEKQSVTLKIR